MKVPIEKVSVDFECPKCGYKEEVSITDLVVIGDPLCAECHTEMDMGMANVSEANSC